MVVPRGRCLVASDEVGMVEHPEAVAVAVVSAQLFEEGDGLALPCAWLATDTGPVHAGVHLARTVQPPFLIGLPLQAAVRCCPTAAALALQLLVDVQGLLGEVPEGKPLLGAARPVPIRPHAPALQEDGDIRVAPIRRPLAEVGARHGAAAPEAEGLSRALTPTVPAPAGAAQGAAVRHAPLVVAWAVLLP